ncbi:MAG: zinc-dependent peptidase [Burkholderiaceae bacterium]|nr:zinc-dependent peptidase [Burkholderiaceae bacterium]
MLLPWLRRLFRRKRREIPDALWRTTVTRLPLLRRLAQDELRRLKVLTEELLHTKTITGARGFEVTDEIAVFIMAQAALPVLNLTLDLYDDIPGVVVYPGGFVVNQKQVDHTGLVQEWRETLAGQAMDAGGGIVLSWEDVEESSDFWSRRNVVIHEFAHKIDMKRRGANGCPPFLLPYHKGMQVEAWQRVFTSAFEDFRWRVRSFHRPLQITADSPPDLLHQLHEQGIRPLPMDPYAGKNAAEFFAVASEAFFTAPTHLAIDYPDLYHMMERYYLQRPIAHT